MMTLSQRALAYHALPTPGKLSVEITKAATTPEDLALAYSPGVAAPVLAIARDPAEAYALTGKGNSVAVITNGTAILGLGDLGPLASKPVMEGKALLFKRFGGINAVDIEVNCDSTAAFIEVVAAIADTFGGINLEDIRAPECFEIEKALMQRCKIPVFHDDQHGTAIVTAAALLNALEIQGKTLATAKIVCLGAGAAACACIHLLLCLGLNSDNLLMVDRQGVVRNDRLFLPDYKRCFATSGCAHTLSDAMVGADVFIGLSGANLLSEAQLALMAPNPVIFACSNPDPEIDPVAAKRVRDDLIIATGRSDYPNQVNNVLAFPFVFRGALDVRASCINDAMKLAAVVAIRQMAKEPAPKALCDLYGVDELRFGPDYILPKPLDDRLLATVSTAVAMAAIATGVATVQPPGA